MLHSPQLHSNASFKIQFRLFLMCFQGSGPRCKESPSFFFLSVESLNPVTGGETPACVSGTPFQHVFMARNTFKRRHLHSGLRVSAQFPEANSFWQQGVGSEQPPVILFLHMGSSVKRSLRIPARARRSTCDWPVAAVSHQTRC